jgi:hypothetical protein
MNIVTIQKNQPHPRKLIRYKIKSLLIPNTNLAGRWFISRPKNLWELELPCGLVYFTDENDDHEKTSPRTYKRTCMMTTEVVHQDEMTTENGMDDFLDSRAFEIEATLMNDRFLGFGQAGPVEDVSLVRTSPTIIKAEGQQDIAAIRLYWEIVYRTDAWNNSSLVEFLKFYADYLAKIGDGASASDHVTIRTE